MFLKNAWYAAIWAKDLPAGEPIAKVFLNEPVVLFRTASGTAVALEDRCCHRAAPLSRGVCLEQTIQCGYHGLQFDATGACVHIPGQSHIPPGAQVRNYPVCERHNVVWIWMGDAAKADEEKIPEYGWLDDPGWAAATGYIPMQGHYQLLVDNLHVTYLHKNTISADPSEATVPINVERTEDSVSVSRWIYDLDAPPLFARAGGFNGKVDRWQTTTWKAPSTLAFDVGCATAGTGAPEGDRTHGISIWSMHLITPETETSTHYNWGYVRNFALDDSQQKNLDGGSVEGLMDINADNPPLQMRRIMDNLIAAEATGS
jgi:phenylpropionate dioxygenase-like ring-hydroxylating dioxygenase large terminal subunit